MFRQRGPSQLQQAAPRSTVPATAAPMPPGGHKRLGDMLVEEGLITEQNLQDAILVQKERGGFLGKLLVELGHTTQDQVVSCLVKQCKIPHLSLQEYDIDTSVFNLVPTDMCLEYSLVPIDKLGRILTIAMVDPLNLDAIDAVRQVCPQLRIKPILCSWRDYETVLGKMTKASPVGTSYQDEPAGNYVPKPMEGANTAAASPNAEVPAATAPKVDPLDNSQTMQRAGRTRTQPVAEVAPDYGEDDGISEDMLHDIMVSAVEKVVGGALQDIQKRLSAIEGSLQRSAGRRAITRTPTENNANTFKDLAQSMRRSFGLDVEEQDLETDSGSDLALPQELVEGVFEGLKVSGPLEGLSFETFFGGNTNDFTLAVCKKTAFQPATEYNPLYLYGGVGTGKTHLANAIANEMLARNPDLRIGYLPAAQFLERMEQAIRYGQLEAFRAHYAPWNTLIFDDIGLVGEHHAAQEEMLHLIDVLVSRGCQLILVGYDLPETLAGIESRLKSRLSSGLTLEVKAPDESGRKEMLLYLARMEGVVIPESVIELIAELADEDVRTMRGCLHKVLAMLKLSGDKAPDEQGLAEQVRQMLAASSA